MLACGAARQLFASVLGLITLVPLTSGCALSSIGMNRMADALTATAGAYARDDDPELVRIGAPATLKMIEMLLDRQPGHAGLLLSACSGFTQYAYAFLQVESEIVAAAAAPSSELRQRGRAMYARARGYCLRTLALRHQSLAAALVEAPKQALLLLDGLSRADVAITFWTAAAWAGELTLADDQLVRLPELALVRALFDRALVLDESWGAGAIHEAMIALDGLPLLAGGSAARARQHFARAVELSGGRSVNAFVTLAASVAVRAGDRVEFEKLLAQAIAVDVNAAPDLRLANLVAQRRARHLLAAAARLFRSGS